MVAIDQYVAVIMNSLCIQISISHHSGSISVVAIELSSAKEDAVLTLSARNLDKKDLFGKSDPFFVISRPVGAGWTVVHRSEVVKVMIEIV